MDIVNLKKQILEHKVGAEPLIFMYKDDGSYYLCKQYIEAIIKDRNAQKVEIANLQDISNTDALFDLDEQYIYILEVEDFSADISALRDNLIVVCKKVSDNLKTVTTVFPTLVSWQIEDYVKARLPGLLDAEVKWLCDVAKHDIYLLNQECNKLEIFPPLTQEAVFTELNEQNGYNYLSKFNIFDLTNALVSKNKDSIKKIMLELSNIDVEPYGLITIMLKQFKKIIDIQTNPRATAASLGIPEKQFYAIKNNTNRFTTKQLIEIFEFLTSLDYRIKSGDLVFYESANTAARNNAFIDYLIINLLALSMQ